MTHLSNEQIKELEELYNKLLNDPLILKMKEIPMHRGSNCYIHSFKVVKLCVKRALRRKGYNLKSLIIASALHDYYLYDWRVEREKRKHHGGRHPLIAEANAKRDFNISEDVSHMIKTHMWPLTPSLFPKTKEAKMLNYVDDVIATREFFTCAKHKKKKESKYLDYISHLFD